jgi:hypothetical protein
MAIQPRGATGAMFPHPRFPTELAHYALSAVESPPTPPCLSCSQTSVVLYSDPSPENRGSMCSHTRPA